MKTSPRPFLFSRFGFGRRILAAIDDQYTDRTESIDASVGYSLRAGWRLFVDAKNLTDSGKKRYYLGNRTRPIEQEYTGYSVIGGVKFDF